MESLFRAIIPGQVTLNHWGQHTRINDNFNPSSDYSHAPKHRAKQSPEIMLPARTRENTHTFALSGGLILAGIKL